MKYKLVFLFVFTAVSELFSLESLIPPNRIEELRSQSIITETQFQNSAPLLMPSHRFVQNMINTIRAEINPGFFVESLSLYKKPSPGTWSERERRDIFNSIVALSTLAGLEYFSSSRNMMRVFYETSAVIDNPSSRRPQSDPVFSVPPRELQIFARQRDLTFGDNVYQYTYHSLPDAFVFVQQNSTALNVGIIPAVSRDRLRSVVAIIDTEEYILIYLASMARAASFPGMNQRVGNSFSTRAEALIGWFKTQADGVFK